jgi:probable biosynthetic protein (TIGR04098 family)
MSMLSGFIREQRRRWYGWGIDRRHELRRRLAFYIAKHGFEIGDYSLGQAEVRLYNASRLIVGKYCSFAAGTTFILGGNHPTDVVATSYLDRTGRGPAEHPYTRGDIVIGSDVWIASNAIVLSGVTIGDGAVVGAGSVVLENVPPYAIVFGSPARIVRKRFSDDIIAALLEVRWWDLERQQIDALRPLLHSRDPVKLVDEVRKIKGLPPSADIAAARIARHPPPGGVAGFAAERMPVRSSLSRDEITALIRKECAAVTCADLATPFADLGVDSFGMLALRASLEETSGTIVADDVWSSVVAPADAIRVFSDAQSGHTRAHPEIRPVSELRSYQINMPQMAAGSLSEAWLFKEIGDLHWGQIANGLGVPSSRIADAEGRRLYATFTRVRIDSTAPLASYAENDTITIEGKIARYGVRFFFNDANVEGSGKSIRVRLMSSFSKFGETTTNTSLVGAELSLADGCGIPGLAELPEFAREYRAQRTAALAQPIFECEYAIVPYHDINGVGLLYFAAYPIINDICAGRYAGRSYANYSTRRRDIFYFANCDAGETLIYRIHRWTTTDDGIEVEESLSRKSDATLMSYSLTHKSAHRQ